jgi:uncharacterized protein YecE (DUF72 family)
MLVEFRHRSWLDDEHREQPLAFLAELGAGHVVVDAPKTDAKHLGPAVLGGDRTAMVRGNVSGRSHVRMGRCL